MDEENSRKGTIQKSLGRISRICIGALMLLGVPMLLIAIFGLSIKMTSEYKCALQVAEGSDRVLSVTGTPLQAGFFAWTKFYESGGLVSQGAYFTSLSGPKGGGTMEVNYYRSPVGATLGIWFTADGEEIEIFNAAYPCGD